MSQVERGADLPRLTALRWYAALLVMVHHLPDVIDWRPARWLPGTGTLGVSFFFVLSGFVLSWSYRGTAREFYQRRFARIYPATAVSIGLAALILWDGLHWMSGGSLGLGTSLTLTQAWFPQAHYPVYSYNTVTWTLSCEAFFYLLLPWLLVLAARRSTQWVIVCTAVALGMGFVAETAAAQLGGNWISNGIHQPLLRLPEFLLGVAIGIAVERGWTARIRPPIALAMCLGALVLGETWPSPMSIYAYLPGVVAVLCLAISGDLAQRPGLLRHRLSVCLGELSFCFYLLHVMVDRLVAHTLGFSGHHYADVEGLAIAAFLVVASAVAAAALHHLVELPMRERLSHRIRGQRTQRYAHAADSALT